MRIVLAILVVVVAGATIALLTSDRDAQPDASARADAGPVARENRPVQLERPDPNDYEAGSPRRAAEAFLAAWHDREWDRAVHWSAPPWRRGFDRPAQALRFRLGGQELRGAIQRKLTEAGDGEATLDVLPAVSDVGSDEIQRRPVTLELREEPGRRSVEPPSIPSTRSKG